MHRCETSGPILNALKRAGFSTVCGLVLLLAIAQTRVPLGLLQMAAWTGMYVEYSQTFDSKTAFRLTLNGTELCGICEAVENLRETAKQLPELASALEQVRLLPLSAQPIACPLPEEARICYRDSRDRSMSQSEEPQGPPPKIV